MLTITDLYDLPAPTIIIAIVWMMSVIARLIMGMLREVEDLEDQSINNNICEYCGQPLSQGICKACGGHREGSR